jgi:hypothetical protein
MTRFRGSIARRNIFRIRDSAIVVDFEPRFRTAIFSVEDRDRHDALRS